MPCPVPLPTQESPPARQYPRSQRAAGGDYPEGSRPWIRIETPVPGCRIAAWKPPPAVAYSHRDRSKPIRLTPRFLLRVFPRAFYYLAKVLRMRSMKALRPTGPLLVICLVALMIGPVGVSNLDLTPDPADMNIAQAGGPVLVIAPHPDDECIAAAGLLAELRKRGVRVLVVLVTCGDGSRSAAQAFSNKQEPSPVDYRALGECRSQESLRAMGALGVGRGDVVFLGYPDGSLGCLWNEGWDPEMTQAANGALQSPYMFSYTIKVPYCERNLAGDIEALLRKYSPGTIIYPHAEDANPDHAAVNAFVQYALIKTGSNAREYTYLVHKRGFPCAGDGRPGLPLYPPESLLPAETEWEVFPLNPRLQQAKERALRAYKTPLAIKGDFLRSFERSNELFLRQQAASAEKVGNPDITSDLKHLALTTERL